MGDPDLLIGLLGLLLAFVSTVALVLLFAVPAGRADRREEAFLLTMDEASSEPSEQRCEPVGEPEFGVRWHASGAKKPVRALLQVQRSDTDEIAVYLQPVDGRDQAEIVMPRATADALGVQLARARRQEVYRA